MNNLKFDIEEMKVIDEISDSQLAILEVYVCHDGMNLHEKPISLDTIKKASHTLINKFLVAGYNGVDFKSHEKDQLITGFFPSENDIRYAEKNGKTYLVANAIMSKVYAQWAYDIFVNSENKKSVSMEITVLATEIKEDGYEWITSFLFNGVTILNDNINPACPDSDARVFKFSEAEVVTECEDIYSNYLSPNKYKDIDFSIPENVKDSVLKGIELRNKYKRGGTAVDFSTAKYLSENEKVTPDKIKHLVKYFTEHDGDGIKNRGKLSNKFISWNLHGASESLNWASEVFGKMNELDSISTEEKLVVTDDKSVNFDESEETINEVFEENINKQNMKEGKDDMDKTAIMEKMSSMEIMGNYQVLGTEDNFAFFMDTETKTIYGVEFTIEEDSVNFDMESKKMAKMGCKYELMEEEEEEDKDVYMSMFSTLELKIKKLDFSYENKRQALRKKVKEALSVCWIWLDDFDEEYVYVDHDGKLCRYAYNSETYEIDLNSMIEVVEQKSYMEFNADANIEAVAQVEQEKLEDENMKEQLEDAEELAEVEIPEIIPGAEEVSETTKMGESLKEMGYSIEDVEKLAKFKSDTEAEELRNKVEFACSNVSEDMPKEEIDNFKEKFPEFENFSAWENALKSMAFDFAKEKEPKEKENILRYANENINPKTETKKWWEK